MKNDSETKFERLVTSSHKSEIISALKSNPEFFSEAVALTISDKHPYSWRSAWVLWSCMEINDIRLQNHVKKIIDILPETSGSQQRELLNILQRMEISPEYEGKLFDVCVKIWEQIDKIPSIRFNAFRILISITQKYPELKEELNLLTESYYIDSLSAGIKNSALKMIRKINSY
jgi:hypothetical protein